MLYVGETNVWLTRAAKSNKKDSLGQRVAPQKGAAIEARLIIAVVKDINDKDSCKMVIDQQCINRDYRSGIDNLVLLALVNRMLFQTSQASRS